MFKLEFPAENKPLAAAIGRALLTYGAGTAVSTALDTFEDLIAKDIDGLDLNPDADNGPDGEVAEPCAECGAVAAAGHDNHYDGCSLDDTAEPPAADTRLDHNQVPFNDEFCGESEKPFYASGKRAGQWKKKRNVDDAAYDAWYAETLTGCNTEPESTDSTDTGIDTANAFGANGKTDDPAGATVPQDCGQFMAWVSELQAAGRLTQVQVAAAYTNCGIDMMDIFPPAEPAAVAARVAQLHTFLSATAAL